MSLCYNFHINKKDYDITRKNKGEKMENKGFKLYLDGEVVKDKFDEDIIVYDEPRKVTNERLFKDLDIKPTGKETDKELYETIFEKAEQKYKEKICYIADLYEVLGYGEYMHVSEDNPQFIDDLEKYPFSIWEGEAIGDNGAGETNIDSEWYGIQIGNWPNWKWVYCKEYKEITE